MTRWLPVLISIAVLALSVLAAPLVFHSRIHSMQDEFSRAQAAARSANAQALDRIHALDAALTEERERADQLQAGLHDMQKKTEDNDSAASAILHSHANWLADLELSLRVPDANELSSRERALNASAISPDALTDSLDASVRIGSEYIDARHIPPAMLGNATGTGTIVRTGDGATWILTAWHVVQPLVHKFRFVEPAVTIYWGAEDDADMQEHSARLAMANPKHDLALLKVDADGFGHAARTLAMTDLNSIELNDAVYLIGCPLGVSPRVSRGYVTARKRADEGYIETDCQALWGSSGGGLFWRGALIGVLSQGRSSDRQMAEYLSMAVAPEVVSEFLLEAEPLFPDRELLLETGISFSK